MRRKNRHAPRFRLLKTLPAGKWPAKIEDPLRTLLDYALRLGEQPETIKLSMSLVLLVLCTKAGFAREILDTLKPLREGMWNHIAWEEAVSTPEMMLIDSPSPQRVERFHDLLLFAMAIESCEPELATATDTVALAHFLRIEALTLEALRWLGHRCPEDTWIGVRRMLPQFEGRFLDLAGLLRTPADKSLFL